MTWQKDFVHLVHFVEIPQFNGGSSYILAIILTMLPSVITNADYMMQTDEWNFLEQLLTCVPTVFWIILMNVGDVLRKKIKPPEKFFFSA